MQVLVLVLGILTALGTLTAFILGTQHYPLETAGVVLAAATVIGGTAGALRPAPNRVAEMFTGAWQGFYGAAGLGLFVVVVGVLAGIVAGPEGCTLRNAASCYSP